MTQYMPVEDPEFLANPYIEYDRIRTSGACVWDADRSVWLVTTYDLCSSLLSESNASKDTGYADLRNLTSESPLMRMKARWILLREGSYHSRARAILASSLSRQGLAHVRPMIDAMVDAVLADVEFETPIDAMEIAAAIPFGIITQLTGLCDEDPQMLRASSRALFRTLEPGISEGIWNDGEHAVNLLTEAIQRSLHREVPSDATILSDCVRALNSDLLLEDEAVASLALMFIAGHETTTQMIGNTIANILTNRVTLEVMSNTFNEEPSKIAELWRFDTSVQNTLRIARQNLDLDGARVKPGERLLCLLGAANRDPLRFESPNILDFDRPQRAHLGFGGGPHFCLGSALAQAQLLQLILKLAQLCSTVTLVGQLVWNPSITFRGPLELPVVLGN